MDHSLIPRQMPGEVKGSPGGRGHKEAADLGDLVAVDSLVADDDSRWRASASPYQFDGGTFVDPPGSMQCSCCPTGDDTVATGPEPRRRRAGSKSRSGRGRRVYIGKQAAVIPPQTRSCEPPTGQRLTADEHLPHAAMLAEHADTIGVLAPKLPLWLWITRLRDRQRNLAISQGKVGKLRNALNTVSARSSQPVASHTHHAVCSRLRRYCGPATTRPGEQDRRRAERECRPLRRSASHRVGGRTGARADPQGRVKRKISPGRGESQTGPHGIADTRQRRRRHRAASRACRGTGPTLLVSRIQC